MSDGVRISVSVRPRLDVAEGLRVEFKKSVFWSAGQQRQVEVIAKTIAAFMNGDGGDLYIGVDDAGYVIGIESDLQELVKGSSMTIVAGRYKCDKDWLDSYKEATYDKYRLKLNNIVEGYLGKSALGYVGDLVEDSVAGVRYFRLPIMSANEVILFQAADSKWSELWVRYPGEKKQLRDRERDDFVSRKGRDSAIAEYSILRTSLASQNDDRLSQIETKLDMLLAKIEERDVDETRSKTSEVVDVNGSEDSKTKSDAKSGVIDLESSSSIDAVNAIVKACAQGDCVRTVAADTTTMDVMDAYEGECDGGKPYKRLILKVSGSAFKFIPYYGDSRSGEFLRYPGADFRLRISALIIERNSLLKPYGNGFSFSDLKKGYIGDLDGAMWKSVTDDVRNAKDDTDVEVELKNPIQFRAHTTDSFYCKSVQCPNRYFVTGIVVAKTKLLHCPEKLTLDEWREFERKDLNAYIAAIIKLLAKDKNERGQNG